MYLFFYLNEYPVNKIVTRFEFCCDKAFCIIKLQKQEEK